MVEKINLMLSNLVKEKYEQTSRNQPQIIERNGARLFFDCIKAINAKVKHGEARIP